MLVESSTGREYVRSTREKPQVKRLESTQAGECKRRKAPIDAKQKISKKEPGKECNDSVEPNEAKSNDRRITSNQTILLTESSESV